MSKRCGDEPDQNEQQDAKRTRNEIKGLTEADVGITAFLHHDIPGFTGILKQRYTDFLVNEIDPEGNVVHLKDLGGVENAAEKSNESVQDKDLANRQGENKEKPRVKEPAEIKPFTLDAEDRSSLEEMLGKDIVEAMIQLNQGTTGKMETTKPIESKDTRTKLHQLIRKAFDSGLETKTMEGDTMLISKVARGSGSRDRSRREKGKRQVQNGKFGPQKRYIHLTVYKENKDTMEVASLLARFLRLPPKALSYAGTKDRRGVTVQRASLSSVRVDRVANLNKTLRGIKLGGFSYSDEPIGLGQLNGNEFLITVREVNETPQIIDKAMESLKNDGFINYFGMQRFGTFSVSTHTIGAHMLRGDYQGVANLILSPQELVSPDSIEARQLWLDDSSNPQKVLDKMPRKCVAECSILRALCKSPNDFLGGVMQIPRNLRIMYGHAYQSFIWNSIASIRLNEFGFKVVEGDLVVDEKKTPEATSTAIATAAAAEEDDDDFAEDCKAQETFTRARPVTQEEIDNGTFTIYNVVLPTPGFDIIYPKNLLHYYTHVMEKDNLDPKSMRRNIRDLSLSGTYRPLVVKPINLQWFHKSYTDPLTQLVHTDLDILNDPSLNQIVDNTDIVTSSSSSSSSQQEQEKSNGLIIKMQLGVAQYATMALREAMKLDTARRGHGMNVRLNQS